MMSRYRMYECGSDAEWSPSEGLSVQDVVSGSPLSAVDPLCHAANLSAAMVQKQSSW